MILPPTVQVLASLTSRTCPACGKLKMPKRTLCQLCYRGLPKPLQIALYARAGRGYESNVQQAFDALGLTEFHLPPLRTPPAKGAPS